MKLKFFKLIVISVILFVCGQSVYSVRIPPNLVHCYRGNETLPWNVNTLQVLLELIRKVEDANPTSMDMRRLSTQILHTVRIDGIQRAPAVFESEFVTPFHANGIMTAKFELLLHLVSNSPGSIEFEEFLTPRELCLLHQIVSSSVEPFERGDESVTCPLTLISDNRMQPKPWITQHKIQGKNSTTSTTTISNPVSRCPLERGTIRTKDFGTLSPGTLIAAISAGLQPQNVQINQLAAIYGRNDPYKNLETMETADTRKTLDRLFDSLESINNQYAATLAGDLAEVCVYQGPYLGSNVSIGLTAMWNDTHFPRIRYIAESHRGRWEMTDAEILAGIDGLLLAQQVNQWINRVHRMKLSQIIDMFYSHRGIPATSIENINTRSYMSHAKPKKFPITSAALVHSAEEMDNREADVEEFTRSFSSANSKIRAAFDDPLNGAPKLARFSAVDDVSRACDRLKVLEDMISSKQLKDETFKMAQVLQFRTSSFWISEPLLQAHCDSAVDRFFEYSKNLLQTLPSCAGIENNNLAPSVDLTIVVDGSRNEYNNLRLISFLAELAEVSSYSSTLSVIHGETGEYLVERTHSVVEAFEQLRNFSGPYPTRLSLSRSFGSLVTALHNQTEEEKSRKFTGGNSQLVLVVSQGQRVVQSDYESARRILEGSLQRFPDLYFIFLTNDVQSFAELTSFVRLHDATTSDRLRYSHIADHYSIVSASLEPSSFESELSDILRHVPKRLVSAFCHEDSAQRNKWDDAIMRYEFENYLSPHQELRYRINPMFMHGSEEVRVEFQGVGYGDFTVCSSRSSGFNELSCKTVADMNVAWFNVSRPCVNQPVCPPLFFSVTMDSSYIKCSENDCRYPDQVRFLIRHEGLNCERSNNAGNVTARISLLMIFVLATLLFKIRI